MSNYKSWIKSLLQRIKIGDAYQKKPIRNITKNINTKKIKEIMDQRYKSGEAYEYNTLWDVVRHDDLINKALELSQDTKDKLVLDLGCGEGGMAHYVHNACLIIGCDISLEALKSANRILGSSNKQFMTLDIQRLSFRNDTFDIAFAIEVLEHILDLKKALKEIYRVLKKKGQFILSSPNKDSLHLRINRALGYQDFRCSFDHIREYTYEEMCNLLEMTRFKIAETKGCFLMPYWGIQSIENQKLRKLTDNNQDIVEMLRLLGDRVGAEFGFCYIIEAIK